MPACGWSTLTLTLAPLVLLCAVARSQVPSGSDHAAQLGGAQAQGSIVTLRPYGQGMLNKEGESPGVGFDNKMNNAGARLGLDNKVGNSGGTTVTVQAARGHLPERPLDGGQAAQQQQQQQPQPAVADQQQHQPQPAVADLDQQRLQYQQQQQQQERRQAGVNAGVVPPAATTVRHQPAWQHVAQSQDQDKQPSLQHGSAGDVNPAPPAPRKQEEHMQALLRDRQQEEQQASQRDLEQRRQQERLRLQQEAIRQQVQQQRALEHLQQDQAQQRSQQQPASSGPGSDSARIQPVRMNVPTRAPAVRDVGGAESMLGKGNESVVSNQASANPQGSGTTREQPPDAPQVAAGNSDLNGLSEEFRRGLIKKVQAGEEVRNMNQAEEAPQNMNQVPVQRDAYPPEQPVREVGGLRINWDWEDFSITFNNYGAAEMKVRVAPHPTTGEPWPLPQYYSKKDHIVFVVDPYFEFVVNSNISCDIIEQAVERYKRRILEDSLEDMYSNLQNAEGAHVENPESKYATPMYMDAPMISKFSLKIRKPCTLFPSLDSDESYDLVVKKNSAYLWANEVWGLLRGLETLSQLIWQGLDNRLYIKESVISDFPRFPHRGILVDSSRHFIFKEVLFEMMDAMEMNKLNVLHWHIVDDQSFPYESQVFPELSAKGAFHPTFVYSLQDIAELIDYARMRGIRVLPEFDTPGHTYSWGLSRPELLTQCYAGASSVKGYLGPINPVANSTYRFMKTLFGEILNVFKDEFIHLGGDEVPLGCWQSNPEVLRFGEQLARENNLPPESQSYFGNPSSNIRLVYEYYVNRVMKDVKEVGEKRKGVKFVMWQEVMNNDLKLPNDTLIQVWMGDMADVSRATTLGYNVLYSTCWYLDHMEYGVKWPKYYQCDPVDNSYGYNIDEKKVKGGEACLWAEYIDNENLISTTFPRASAVAERLWSNKEIRNLDSAGERLSEHRCRMLRNGISAGQVSGPDYCLKRGARRHQRDPECEGNSCHNSASHSADRPSAAGIQFKIGAKRGTSSECTWLFQIGGNITILAIIAVIAFVALMTVSRNNGKLHALRTCRHRTILVVFLTVLFVYFMCYTTMWMQFSGSFRRPRGAATSGSH